MLNNPLDEKEEMSYKAYLESIGDSIVVVADDEIVKTTYIPTIRVSPSRRR